MVAGKQKSCLYFSMKKSRTKRIFRFKVMFCFVAMIVIVSLPNYLGMPITPKSIENEQFNKWNMSEATGSISQYDNLNEDLHKSFKLGSFLVVCVWLLVILTVSTALFGGIIAFLNDQPLNRQCLLLYLYKDLMMLILARVWMTSFEIGWYELNELKNGTSLGKLQANIFESTSTISNLAIILNMNFIRFYELFIATSKLTDPFLEHFGYADEKTIKFLRYLNLGYVIVFKALSSFIGLHSVKYYMLIGSQMKFKNLPTGPLIFVIWHVIMVFICIAAYSINKLLEKCHESKADKYGVSSEEQNSASPANAGEDTDNPIQVSLPKIFVPTFFTISFLLIGILVILQGSFDNVPYMVIDLLLVGILLPIMIVLKNNECMCYLKRTTLNRIITLSQYCQAINCSCKIRRRSPVVAPVT